ncbi:hypothetical protein BT96DRAFT_985361 [Gymnopus androsaceus JB14]|uniref:Uncharacterized protein n=1 Tax=Gymnopus androsaceus JB14 TaxID=1447944 RepID=A0A6A4IIH2_9AGAR|nr:hypothetical protein BT96DRAFT_985361 [Gymnopus androsaceus JB14]
MTKLIIRLPASRSTLPSSTHTVTLPSPRKVRSSCGQLPSVSLKKAPSPTTSRTRGTSSHPPKANRMNDAQRKALLENDSDILTGSVRQKQVVCRGCRQSRALDHKINYGAANWIRHKDRCTVLKAETETRKAAETLVLMSTLVFAATPNEPR